MSQLSASIPPFFESSFRELGDPSLAIGRVVRGDPPPLRVVCEGRELSVAVSGRLTRHEIGAIVAGDWVAVDVAEGVVRHVLPRRTAFLRRAAGRETRPQVVAANVDVVFLLMGLDRDFNVHRLSRYLALGRASGAEPVVFLTKAASAADREHQVAMARRAAGRIAVHAIDVVDGVGADEPGKRLGPGITAALLGSSGVGKSTLLNHLLGRDVAPTGSLSAAFGKGRHTTTHRELFEVPSGGAIVDTPGMRELALYCDEDDISAVFEDVANAADGCKFRDCRHRDEPGCAVRAAIDRGALDSDRAREFEKLSDEVVRERQARRLSDKTRGRRAAKLVRDVMRVKYGRRDG
jgi:ribosome biogenesis GTPase